MLPWCYLISMVMTIPWSIFAFPTTKWALTEQDNFKLVDFARWYLVLVFFPVMLYLFYYCVVEGFCYNYKNSNDNKKTSNCRLSWFYVVWFLNFLCSIASCYWAVHGAMLISKANKGYSTWFWISVIMMDAFLFLYFIIFAAMFFWSLYVSCCAKDKSIVKEEKGCCAHFFRNFHNLEIVSICQPSSNKKNMYANESGNDSSMYDRDIF